jgi:hypothetical protein
MAYVIWDFSCKCGNMEEHLVDRNSETFECQKCGGVMQKVFTPHGSYLREEAPWLKSVLDVVDKEDTRPFTLEFRQDPTRTNYKKWMKGSGLRPLEPGEENYRKETDPRQHERMVDYLMKKKQERERVEIR